MWADVSPWKYVDCCGKISIINISVVKTIRQLSASIMNSVGLIFLTKGRIYKAPAYAITGAGDRLALRKTPVSSFSNPFHLKLTCTDWKWGNFRFSKQFCLTFCDLGDDNDDDDDDCFVVRLRQETFKDHSPNRYHYSEHSSSWVGIYILEMGN